MRYILENDLKIDIIGQHHGENLARISDIQSQIESSSDQAQIEEYNNQINDLLAANAALEALKSTIVIL
jgi:hypothetical protein